MRVTEISPDELLGVDRYPVGSIGLAPSGFAAATGLAQLRTHDGLGEVIAFAVEATDGVRFLIVGHVDAPDVGLAVESDRPVRSRLSRLLKELGLDQTLGTKEWDGASWRDASVQATVYPEPLGVVPAAEVFADDFSDAESVGIQFAGGSAVILNLEHADMDVARRLLDFASGLCYGLDGSIERLSPRVYHLRPSLDARRRTTRHGSNETAITSSRPVARV